MAWKEEGGQVVQGCQRRFWIYPLLKENKNIIFLFCVILDNIFNFYPVFGCFWPTFGQPWGGQVGVQVGSQLGQMGVQNSGQERVTGQSGVGCWLFNTLRSRPTPVFHTWTWYRVSLPAPWLPCPPCPLHPSPSPHPPHRLLAPVPQGVLMWGPTVFLKVSSRPPWSWRGWGEPWPGAPEPPSPPQSPAWQVNR